MGLGEATEGAGTLVSLAGTEAVAHAVGSIGRKGRKRRRKRRAVRA